MKQNLIVVPLLFLGALIFIGAILYSVTSSKTACTGEDCEELSSDELADLVIEARTQ